MQHVPVLLKEVLEVIMPRDGGRYFDGTMGNGGHALAILEKSSPGGLLAGTDLDRQAISKLTHILAPYGDRVHLFNRNFKEIDKICIMLGWENLDGILLDLGMSSAALDDADRGFSFMREGPLDMRFSPEEELSAYQVVNSYEEGKLASVISQYGQERFAARIVRAIVRSRPLETTSELADVVCSAIPRRHWPKKIHPATKTFQAIRIEVNHEIQNLQEFLPKAASLLSPGGVLAAISFHSLEDRIVKQFFSGPGRLPIFPRGLPDLLPEKKAGLEKCSSKPFMPTTQEIQSNPRSRSARLRAARRVA